MLAISSSFSTNDDTDSTVGKLFEKAGSLLNKDSIAEKGRVKREAAGADVDGSNY